MLLSATNTVDKQDVQLRKEDESQWVASGVVWWSAGTAQLQGSGFVSATLWPVGANFIGTEYIFRDGAGGYSHHCTVK